MIESAKEKLNADCPQQPKLPLIRLRVIYTNEDHIFNSIRFGQQYGEKVRECIRFDLMIRFFKSQYIQTGCESNGHIKIQHGQEACQTRMEASR